MELVIVNYSPRVYPHRPAYQVVKRLLDVVLCILALPFLVPVLIACAIAIKLDSSGPVLFIQERIGKDGRPFRMFKFRTMKHNLDDSFHRAFMKAFVKGQMDGGHNGTGKNGKQSDPPNAFRRAFIEAHADGKKNGAQKTYKPFQDSQVTWVGRILRKTSLDELPATGMERSKRGDELGGAAAERAVGGRRVRALALRAVGGPARHHRLGAGQGTEQHLVR